jgi:hypothetical protein
MNWSFFPSFLGEYNENLYLTSGVDFTYVTINNIDVVVCMNY